MKKKIALSIFICSCIILFIIIDNIVFKNAIIILLLLILSDLFAYKKYQNLILKKIPNILIDLNRNYDKIVLGASNPIKTYNIEDINILNLSNYKRNLYTDILVMKRFYSFLKKGGTVSFNINCKDGDYLLENKISPFDYDFLHNVTLLEHNIKIFSIQYKLMRYTIGIKYFIALLHNNSKVITITDKEARLFISKIYEINNFCRERELFIEYNLYSCNELIKKVVKRKEDENIHYNFIS